jgi:hypothetical protein
MSREAAPRRRWEGCVKRIFRTGMMSKHHWYLGCRNAAYEESRSEKEGRMKDDNGDELAELTNMRPIHFRISVI